MKQLICSTIFVLFCMIQVQAEGIKFFKGTWQEALEEAKKQDKVIFVDAYAVWCGPCKRMSKNVFPNTEVGKYYNKNFINLKLDMEKGEGLVFRKKYPVSAFPTLFYIDANGKVVQKVKGARDVNGFIELGKKALSQADNSADYEKAYNEGNRDPELVYKYVRALNKARKPSLKIANEYIKSQEDLTTAQNLKFILEAAVEADSRIFGLLIKHQDKIVSISSPEAVKERIYKACENTAQKAIEFESKELLEEAKAKMKKYYPEKAKSFALLVEMDFCLAMNNAEHFVKACKTFAKTEAKGDPKVLNNIAYKIADNFQSDTKAMKQAESFAKSAAEKGNIYTYYLTYASILDINGKKTEAIAAANKSLELAKVHAKEAVRNVELFIERLAG